MSTETNLNMTKENKKSYLIENIVIVLSLIIVAGAWFFSYTITRQEGVIIESSEGDFTFRMPEGWESQLLEPNEQTVLYGLVGGDQVNPDYAASAIVLVAPDEDGTQNANESVEALATIYADFGFEFISKEESKINGVPGVFYEASLSDSIGEYYQAGFITIHNGKKYTVITQGIANAYGGASELYKTTVKSIKIN